MSVRVRIRFFYHITTGQRIRKSTIFHAQIGTKYHEYHIKRVNSETLNLICSDRSCPAKALVKVRKESNLITIKGEKNKTNGSKQKTLCSEGKTPTHEITL